MSPRKTMSPPEKRRPPPPGRGTARVPSTRSSTATGSTSTSTSSTLIAPPPRAALSRASSPAPPDNSTARNNDPGDNNVPPAAAAAVLLREKDARIASLERELAKLSTGTTATATGENETAAGFWQAKYVALERRHQQLQAQLQLARRAVTGNVDGGFLRDDRADDDDDDDGEEEEVEEYADDADANWKLARENQELLMAWAGATKALAEREREIESLRAQVSGLKAWVSNSTRSDGQVQMSDEVFGEGMARLGNGLQNWVLVNFRRAKIDLSSADEATISELGRLVPMYEDLAATAKIHLLQSIVSRVLVELVFDTYFVGLPSDMARQLTQVETFLASFASPEFVNQWRSLTLTIIKKDAGETEAGTCAVADEVVSNVNAILDRITNTTSTKARDQGLQALVRNAIELSRLLAVQRAVFRVEMPQILPHQRIMFNAETMEDIGGEDEESLADRDICCVTFPGIVKRGDESGAQLQYRNVISKARVLCGPERAPSAVDTVSWRLADLDIPSFR